MMLYVLEVSRNVMMDRLAVYWSQAHTAAVLMLRYCTVFPLF